jgi:filamentous hemagglutinin family protein
MHDATRNFRRNALSVAILSALAGMVQALPQGGTVAAGSGSLNANGSSLTVNQGTQKLIIDWQSFGIGVGESVQFVQPNASAVALNRVLGNNASEIFGSLRANGQVFLTNPNGILFGSTAQVDVGGLVASTLAISNDDFLNGSYTFNGADGGRITNHGTLQASLGGVIALLAPEVRNEGVILAKAGAIGLAAGTRITLDLSTGLSIEVEQGALNAVIENRHAIRAEGGLILLSASAQQTLLGGLINNTGVIEAGSVSEAGGVISLTAGYQSLGGSINTNGTTGGAIAVTANNIDQYGSLSAKGTAGDGGTITVRGERLIQTSAALIDASGSRNGGDVRLALGTTTGGAFLSGTINANGGSGAGGDITLTGADLSLVAATLNANGESGGQIRVGGDYQGANPDIANAQSVYVNSSSVLNANAGVNGAGGRVIVWSDVETEFNGTINARGGSVSGDGGFAEVSGKETLGFAGDANLQAVQGTNGTLLLDPKNLTISSVGGGLAGFRLVDPTSLTGNNFGGTMLQLGNGNIVATSTSDDFAASNGGAVYLFNLSTGALISAVRGAGANSTIGSSGITNLGNGNFLIRSIAWNDGVSTNLGAITFGNGTTGVSGVVDASNSLVGSVMNDQIGSNGVTVLTGGNYVVQSAFWDNGAAADAGAVTWGSGSTGVSGVVGAVNSLVGSSMGDNVGVNSLFAVGNENYLVRAANWDNGASTDAGAITAFNSATGITGVVSASNSLVGSSAGDAIGNGGITLLGNGNYLVSSWNWDNGAVVDAGAVTFVNGTTGLTGVVSAANSLVGGTGSDYVGYDGDTGITVLANGNYVVSTLYWDNGAATDAGAFTWGSGTTGVSGVVGAVNSLVGSSTNDYVGVGGLTNLGNGNYLLYSYNWDNGTAVSAGAVTFINGTTGVTGVLGAANSLVGSTANDQVGSTGIHVLANGNYLVRSSSWDNGAVVDAGAVTWGSGSTGVSGVVDATNSLVGGSANDYVGNSGLTTLGNGNYLIRSQSWDNGAATEAGAVTFINGATGITGVLSAANSLVGGSANDSVGNTGTAVLANGNYLVSSQYWDNGAAADAGAITFGNGSTGVSGVVGASNSLVGSNTNDYIGNNGITQLGNGNYLVRSSSWNSIAGAVTWGDGATGVSGVVSAANSLVGSVTGDYVGNSVTVLANSNYLVNSWTWDNGAVVDAGAVTFGNGSTGISGVVSAANSLVGSSTGDQVGHNGSGSGIIALSNGNYLVDSRSWDNVGAPDAGAITWGSGSTGVTGVLGAANSLVGGSTNDSIGNFGISQLANGNYLVRSANWDNTATAAMDAGAVTWGNGATGISGVVDASNSLVGSNTNDFVGNNAIAVLSNNNYLVRSTSWDNGAATDAGAVTWGDGSTGISGVVSAANSLVGSTTNDVIGNGGITVVGGTNYVVRSQSWDNGTVLNAGAVTWGSGTSGVTGVVSAVNSLVGSTLSDNVGANALTVLANGNYIVRSNVWDNGTLVNAGAVTWGSGTSGVSGVITASNSLVGGRANDTIGSQGITLLTNGHYLVRSAAWDSGSGAQAGAVTWANGLGGTVGVVDASNSLVGSRANDQVGLNVPVALANGNYIVRSQLWDNTAAAADAGAVTWGNGQGGTVGVISAANSLVGGRAGDNVGNAVPTLLSDGNYLLRSVNWDNGAVVNAGAISFINSTTGASGVVSAANSIVGTVASEIGASTSVTVLSDGNYLVRSPLTTTAGRVTVVLPGGNMSYAQGTGQSLTLHPEALLNILNRGTNLTLQASNDLTVSSALSVNNVNGDGGDLTLQAGRSLAINAAISTDNGSLTLIANDILANGVIAADRDAGNANLSVTAAINAGSGDVSLQLRNGQANAGGLVSITGAITANTIAIRQDSGAGFTLNAPLTSTATSGTGIEIVVPKFTSLGSGALSSAPGSHWRVWSGDPADDNRGALAYDFKQYNAVYGSSTVLGTGNGFLYSEAPVIDLDQLTSTGKVYDGTTTYTGALSFTASNAIDGDTVTFDVATAEFADKNAGAAKAVNLTGASFDSATDGSVTVYGYQFTGTGAATAAITAKAITAAGITAANKVYDATTAVVLDVSAASTSGIIAGDTVTVDASSITGGFDDKNVGTAKTVTVTGFALGGADAGNYTISGGFTTTADITAKSVSATGITASNKVYDALTSATVDASGAALSGAIGGDTVSLVGTVTGTFDSKNVGTGKTVTIAGLGLTGADAGNYSLDATTTTADVTAKSVTASGLAASNKVYDGNTTATLDISGVSFAGGIAGDDLTIDTASISAAFDDKNAGSGKTVNVSGITLGGADAGNYSFSGGSLTTTADITAKAIDATGISASHKVYDALLGATLDASGAALSGVVLGDTLTLDVSSISGAFGDKNAGSGKTVTVTGLGLGGADIGNYTLNGYTTTADITAKSVSATGITASNKVYDAQLSATLDASGASLTGVIGGDTVTFDASSVSGTFDTKNVGTGKTVTVSGVSFGGADGGNYILDPVTTTADITAKSVSATGITASNKVYDALTGATLNTGSAGLSGAIAGDTLSLDTSAASGTFGDKNVGAGKTVSVASLALGGADAGNYSLATYSTTADITAKSVSATGITASNKVYDALTGATLNTGSAGLSGVIAGDTLTLDTSSTSGAFADKNVGTGKTVTVAGLSLGGADVGNYTLDSFSTSADITAKSLSASGITASNKVYDALAGATLNTGSAAFSGVILGDTVTFDASAASGSFADKNVGTAKTVTVTGLGVSGADSGNYSLAAYTTSADITAKSVSASGITASNKVYDALTGATLNTSAAALSGGILGDSLTLATGSASGAFGDKNVGTGKTVTVSGLTLGGSDAGNYSLGSYTTTANITAKAVSATGITANSKVYDALLGATLNTGSAALSGTVAGDTLTLGTGSATGSFADKNVGSGKIVTVSGLTLGGADAGNYSLNGTTTTAAITARTLSVGGITANNKVYDGLTAATLNTGSASVTGVIAGDTVSFNTGSASGTFSDRNAGTGKTVFVGGLSLSGTDAGNYLLGTYSTSASITAKAISATGITASDKVYDALTGATLHTGSAGLSGLVAGDTVSIGTGSASGAFADKNVGSNKTVNVSGLSLGGVHAGNYTLGSYSTTASITPKAVSATGITASNKVYDALTSATLNSGSAALSGVIAGDTLTLGTGSASGSFADKNAGTGKTVTVAGLSIGGADAGNYSLASYSTTANITAKAVSATGITANDKVYDALTGATLNTGSAGLTGAIAGDTLTLGTGSASGSFADKNVGAAKTVTVAGLSLGGADAGNYSLSGYSTTASITPKAVSATGITAANKVYDALTTATLSTGSAGLSGVIAGDTLTLATGTASGSFADKNVGTGKTVAVAGLSLGGADAGNYTLGGYTTTASITPKSVSATGITANDKVYDALTGAVLNTASAALSGGIAGDTLTLDTSAASGTFADKNAGTGKTVTVGSLALTGADAGNYSLGTTTTTASISAKSISATGITAAGKIYDGLTTAMLDNSSAALSGTIAGDTLSLDTGAASGSFADKNAGAGKTVTVTGLALTGTDAGNYSVDSYSTTADITAKALDATGITAADKVFDGTTVALLDLTAAGLGGVVAGDAVSVDTTGATGVFADRNAGLAKNVAVSPLALTGADAGNYTLNGYSTTADITPKALQVTVDDARMVSGQALPPFTFVLNGLVGGDTASVVSGIVLGTSAGGSPAPGSYAITASGGVAGNYQLSYADGLLIVDSGLRVVDNGRQDQSALALQEQVREQLRAHAPRGQQEVSITLDGCGIKLPAKGRIEGCN